MRQKDSEHQKAIRGTWQMDNRRRTSREWHHDMMRTIVHVVILAVCR
jgi:hypothetical protein